MPFVVCTLAEAVKFPELLDLQSLRLEGDLESYTPCLIFSSCQAQDLSPDVERNAVTTGAQGTADSYMLSVSCTLKSLGTSKILLLQSAPPYLGLLENILL